MSFEYQGEVTPVLPQVEDLKYKSSSHANSFSGSPRESITVANLGNTYTDREFTAFKLKEEA